jgi:hypothetical protein
MSMTSCFYKWLGLWALVVCTAGPVAAQSGIYTCIDAKGRKLTADRPIAECNDREQKVLNPSGTTKGKVGPSLTAQERAEQDAKEKRDAEERDRVQEEKRRDRALMIRYPNKGVHDQERAEALAQITAVIKAASIRLDELARQRKSLDDEMEFYKKDPTKAPAYLRRQVEESNQSQGVQKKFIAEQEAEARRVNLRFDDELTRLKPLWSAK